MSKTLILNQDVMKNSVLTCFQVIFASMELECLAKMDIICMKQTEYLGSGKLDI